MNRDWYRQVVHSVRWSPSKRAEIEARLREGYSEAESGSRPVPLEDWENEISDPTQQQWEMIKSEEYDMKHRRMTRIMTIGILAATLATGGAIGAAVAYAKKHPQTLNITWKNGITLNLTAQECDKPFGQNYYPNPNYNGITHDFTETENGWYYRKPILNEPPTGNHLWSWDGNLNSVLYYTDKETGESVPVCAKPNCLHDGNEYCPATTTTYGYTYLTYYDGYLYAVTTKYLHPENRYISTQIDSAASMGSEECKQVLIRYSPDGTEITELADFGNGIGASNCIVHRGYIWCIVQRQERGEAVENPITHNLTTFESGGWQLWGYELATGKSAVLYDAMGDPTIDHVNEAPSNLTAAGDYLYFNRLGHDWSGAQGLCRLSLLTGEITNGEEEVLIVGSNFTCMSSTHAIRSKQVTLEGESFEKAKIIEYYLIDLETREEKLILTSNIEVEGVPEDSDSHLYILAMNDKYIFTSTTYNGWNTNGTSIPVYFGVYDYEGKLVKQVNTGFTYANLRHTDKKDGQYQTTREYNENLTFVAVTNDIFYVEHGITGTENELKQRGNEAIAEILYCSIDSMLNDETPDWHFAYSAKEEVRGNAQ